MDCPERPYIHNLGCSPLHQSQANQFGRLQLLVPDSGMIRALEEPALYVEEIHRAPEQMHQSKISTRGRHEGTSRVAVFGFRLAPASYGSSVSVLQNITLVWVNVMLAICEDVPMGILTFLYVANLESSLYGDIVVVNCITGMLFEIHRSLLQLKSFR